MPFSSAHVCISSWCASLSVCLFSISSSFLSMISCFLASVSLPSLTKAVNLSSNLAFMASIFCCRCSSKTVCTSSVFRLNFSAIRVIRLLNGDSFVWADTEAVLTRPAPRSVNNKAVTIKVFLIFSHLL